MEDFLLCENSEQARITVQVGLKTPINGLVVSAPIKYNYQEFLNPWDTRIWFRLSSKSGISEGWARDSGGRLWLRAPFTNFRNMNYFGWGVKFNQSDEFKSLGWSPPSKDNFPASFTYTYNIETPPPPPYRYILTWTDGSGTIRSHESTTRPTIYAECSCDRRESLQCGDMASPDYCCLSCGEAAFKLDSIAQRLKSLTDSIS